MEGREFYVTLPSDSSLFAYPENTPSNFKTKLHTPLHLKGNWQVALSEIIYTHTFYNIYKGKNDVTFTDGLPEKNVSTVKLTEGYYQNGKDILTEIHRRISRDNRAAGDRIYLEMENLSRRCKINLLGTSLTPNRHLMKLLGFRNVTHLADRTQKGEEPIDPHRNMHVFYVYSDVIQPVVVGHDQVPLLRTVEVPQNEGGGVVTKSYNPPHYLPLRSNDIEEIEINITTGTGELVHFNGGIAIVKLHFKQISSLPYST